MIYSLIHKQFWYRNVLGMGKKKPARFWKPCRSVDKFNISPSGETANGQAVVSMKLDALRARGLLAIGC
jgi:hypothetical protein